MCIRDRTETVLSTILEKVDELSNKQRGPKKPANSLLTPSSQIHDPQLTGTQLSISAHTHLHLEALKSAIVAQVQNQAGTDTVVTNLRHYEHLVKTSAALDEVLEGLDAGITGDFLAQDIRLSLYHLGEITGTIVSDDLLANIFSKFCIGK